VTVDRLRGLLVRLRAVFRGDAADRELDEEMRTHLEMEVEKNVRAGMPAGEARRQALAVFGGRDAAREAHRDVRGGRWLEDFVSDARFGWRALRHNKALTLAAVVTIALGVGANTAIFSTLHAVVLRPLPFKDSDRLVMLYETNPERGWTRAEVAPANYLDWRAQVKEFEDVGALVSFDQSAVLNHDGQAWVLGSLGMTGNLFSVLGVPAAAGRTFTDEESWNVGERRAMISYRLWQTRFGGDPGVIDRNIDLGGFPVRVIGVAGQSFSIPGRDADIFRPMAWAREQESQVSFRRAHWLRAVARIRDGVTPAQADAALQVVVQRLQREYPGTNTNMGAGFQSLHGYLVGDVRQHLVALQAAVGLLLLIACANVGNLLLVRSADRERESVVRLALGAGRGRLVRQAFTESLLLAALGGMAGIALGWIGTRVLAALQPDGMLPVTNIGLNIGVLAFALAIAIGSGLLFGIGPAIWARHRAPADVLKEGNRGTTGSRLRRWSHGLAVAELAIAVMLMAGGGLLLRSWWIVQSIDPGLESDGVLSVTVNLPPGRFDTRAKRDGFFDEALTNLRAIPGVTGAATVSTLPMTTTSWSSDFAVAGRGREEFGVQVHHREISNDYHAVLRVPVLAGRTFTDNDRGDGLPVVLINEALAKKYFANEDPIGKRIAFDRYPDSSSFWRTIVGVVGSERQEGLELPSKPEFFAPVRQEDNGSRTFVMRTTGDPTSIISTVRGTLATVNPGVAVNRVQTMSEIRDAALARRRFVMTLVLTFAGAGLTMALVGVYGVMAQIARGRRKELGIRLALGAPLNGIQFLLLKRGLGLAALGAALGVAGAVTAGSAIANLLYGIPPTDPITLATVSVLLIAAAVLATVPPARRASRVDPIETLRAE
jgi:putative ABC transport system permease protein